MYYNYCEDSRQIIFQLYPRNRVHTIQWHKEKKETMILRALHKKLHFEQQTNRG